MNQPNRVEVTMEDLVKALGQKEVQIIGLNKLIQTLQSELTQVREMIEAKLKEIPNVGNS